MKLPTISAWGYHPHDFPKRWISPAPCQDILNPCQDILRDISGYPQPTFGYPQRHVWISSIPRPDTLSAMSGYPQSHVRISSAPCVDILNPTSGYPQRHVWISSAHSEIPSPLT